MVAMMVFEVGRRGGGVESRHYYYLRPILLPQLLLPGKLHLVNDGQENPLSARRVATPYTR